MTTRIAGYTIVAELGPANYGTLYTATSDSGAGDELVVKILDRSASDYEFRRLSNEIRLYAQLDDPGLAEIVDAGYSDGVLYYAMRRYDGTLADGTFDTATTLRIVADAARGADALHGLGVAHRDIRPATIARDGHRGRLMDLGLAQVLPGGDASAYGPRGTPDFVAPEVAMGGAASRASDVWSLGLTLHAVLSTASLRPPLASTGVLDRLRHVVNHPPVIDPALPGEVRAIIERCVADDPASRHPTAASLADALDSTAEELT
ncbi:MAG: serine/threonine-protein kinase [Acidimicrobiales bacterium]